jgi:hypothetical protein
MSVKIRLQRHEKRNHFIDSYAADDVQRDGKIDF